MRSPGGWDARRDEAADHIIAHVDRYAPGFKASVIGRLALSPLDLERRFGLIGGDIFHGKMGLDQLFSNRPMLGHADYRMPLRASICAAPAPIPAAASPARPGTMRRARCSRTGASSGSSPSACRCRGRRAQAARTAVQRVRKAARSPDCAASASGRAASA